MLYLNNALGISAIHHRMTEMIANYFKYDSDNLNKENERHILNKDK